MATFKIFLFVFKYKIDFINLRYEQLLRKFLMIKVLFDQFITQGDENMSEITCSMNYIAMALNLIEKTCYNLEIGGHKHMHLLYEKYENALHEAFIT